MEWGRVRYGVGLRDLGSSCDNAEVFWNNQNHNLLSLLRLASESSASVSNSFLPLKKDTVSTLSEKFTFQEEVNFPPVPSPAFYSISFLLTF